MLWGVWGRDLCGDYWILWKRPDLRVEGVFGMVEVRVVGCISEPIDILASVVDGDSVGFVDCFQFEEVKKEISRSRSLSDLDPMDDHEAFTGCGFRDHDHGGVLSHR